MHLIETRDKGVAHAEQGLCNGQGTAQGPQRVLRPQVGTIQQHLRKQTQKHNQSTATVTVMVTMERG
jgi:hypothetical protein